MVADVTVVGAGVIALTTAVALADRDLDVQLVGTTHQGEASSASAGMLAPTIETELTPIAKLGMVARDDYPAYLEMLEARTEIPVPLNREGIIQAALSEGEAEALRGAMAPGAEWLDSARLAALEPALSTTVGGVYSPGDGCVDPLLLMDALRLVVARHSRITIASENVCNVAISSNDTFEVMTDREGHYEAPALVLAAGAWTPTIDGVPRPLPVTPIRGQMVAYAAAPLRHVTYGPSGYLVPKADGRCMAGSTLEQAGFDADTTEEGLAQVRTMAETLCPPLASAGVAASWAGLRPMTPDLLPILGPDPEHPRLVYACGHSRNGILLAPVSAEIVADLVTGSTPAHDILRFRPGRF